MITSRNNETIKETIELIKKSSARNDAKVFIVEGPRMASEIPTSRIVRAFVTPEYEGFLPNALTVSKDVYQKMSDTKSPQGVLAVVRQLDYNLDSFGDGPILILESLQDPGNLGTLFRTAEAAGAGGILMDDGTVDPYNPKVVRSTMGAIFRVPFVRTSSLSDDIQKLKESGYKIFAAHLKSDRDYTKIEYEKAAFMIGNEGNGLSDDICSLADDYLKIPMEGSVESLNAAVSGSLLLYEWHRQNRQ